MRQIDIKNNYSYLSKGYYEFSLLLLFLFSTFYLYIYIYYCYFWLLLLIFLLFIITSSFIHLFIFLLFSIRLSETGLHGYVELARKVKFFGGNGSGTVPLTIGSDEVVQRDSATSAGEDDPHDDNHGRTGPVSSQGRSMLRRRRQFDAQGM